MHRKLKIVIFTDSFTPMIDGVVTATLELVKGLAKRGHKVIVIAPKHKHTKECTYPGVIVKRMPGIPALFYESFKINSIFSLSVLNFLMKEKVDVIHFQTPLTLGAQAIILSKVLNKPLVGTFHTFITDPQYTQHVKLHPRIAQRISWSYSKGYYERCDIITCPTKSAKAELVKNKLKRPIKVISNGIDTSLFSSINKKKAKKKYNPHGKILLFVGRIAYEKNLDYLLDCFKIIATKNKTVKLVMVGSGPQMDDVKEKIKELELTHRVILTGRIERADLITSGIFPASDVFVTASTTETQGISTLEAQANGLVCVGLDAKGIKDIIKNNHNGYLIKEGNKREFARKVLKLLDDKKNYERMRKNTLEEVKLHDIPTVIDDWEKLYCKLIDDHKDN